MKMLLQSNKTTQKNCNTFFGGGGGGGELLAGFRFPQGILKPILGEEREMTIIIMHYGLFNCQVKFLQYQTHL
jgi:hypothetical protein